MGLQEVTVKYFTLYDLKFLYATVCSVMLLFAMVNIVFEVGLLWYMLDLRLMMELWWEILKSKVIDVAPPWRKGSVGCGIIVWQAVEEG